MYYDDVNTVLRYICAMFVCVVMFVMFGLKYVYIFVFESFNFNTNSCYEQRATLCSIISNFEELRLNKGYGHQGKNKKTFGKDDHLYIVDEVIGKGAFGVVYQVIVLVY